MNRIVNKIQVLTLIGATLVSCVRESNSLAQVASEPIIQIDKSEFLEETFKSRYFGEGDWNGALAMDISYTPILRIRDQIEKSLYNGKPLKFLTAWEPQGEAHITTITPVEYQECMWSEDRKIDVLHIKDIEEIALDHNIQGSDLVFLGMGYGEKDFTDRNNIDQTHFVIVTSKNLLKIRHAVYSRYLENGGDAGCWNPDQFYPHITVGYTHKDIHFPDVEKNLKNSQDSRFDFKVTRSESALYCSTVAINSALEIVNQQSNNIEFVDGYIDSQTRLADGLEKYRIVVSDGTGHPDGSIAYVIILEAMDNCNFHGGKDAYTGEVLPNQY